jgi:Polysaccharide pyruvyl transferase
VVFNGEGSVHHDAPRIAELFEFCALMKQTGKRTALVNTQENSTALGKYLHTFDVLAARESRNAALMQEWRPDVRIVPDLAFAAFAAMQQAEAGPHQAAPPMLVVIDSVLGVRADALMDFASFHELPYFLMGRLNVPRYLEPEFVYRVGDRPFPSILTNLDQLASTKGCLTGRFHGLIAALCSGRPVVALPSNTHKIEGLLDDAGISDVSLLPEEWVSFGNHQRLDFVLEALDSWSTVYDQRVSAYLTSARSDIDQLFCDICGLLPKGRRRGWRITSPHRPLRRGKAGVVRLLRKLGVQRIVR